jgi:hypothetical protein
MSECCNTLEKNKGPGYRSPLMAMAGPKEKILYTVLISCDSNEPDCLATIDGMNVF